MLTDELVSIGTDPDAHAEFAWRKVRTLKSAGSGSMFLASHPDSSHIWADTPLNADAGISQSVAVFNRRNLEAGYTTLPIAEIADLGDGPKRVLQPTFDRTGKEVWMVVWNPQDLNSAVVVIDDHNLQPLAVIDGPEITTPTRIYSVAALRGHSEPASSHDAEDGGALYMTNCSNCHGAYGEGDGIVAPDLAVVLQDLRYISERNNGKFPRQVVTEIIDGRELRLAHGPDGMPVWGSAFSRSEGYSEAAQDRVGSKIEALVDFVESMQLFSD